MTAAGGLLTGRVIVVHASEGRYTLRIEKVVTGKFLECTDSSGNSFVIAADDYAKATPDERTQFYVAKAQSDSDRRIRLN